VNTDAVGRLYTLGPGYEMGAVTPAQ